MAVARDVYGEYVKSWLDLFEGGPRLLQSPLIRHALGPVEGQWNISEAADRADGVAPAAVDEDEDDEEEEDEGQADEDLSALMFNVFRVFID
jgi:hypothetical protein